MKKMTTLAAFLIAITLLTPAHGAENASAYSPSDAERARWTMQDMRSIAITLAAYKTDHGTYPADTSMEGLQKLVEPTYVRALPRHDAWGNSFRVSCDGTKACQIVSSGSDGRFEESSWGVAGEQTDYRSDAVLTTDRTFVRSWQYR